MSAGRGWYSRGYLPHFDIEGRTQFLTWRLEDAVPKDVIARWRDELKHERETRRKQELAQRIEIYCDASHGSCVLRKREAAEAMISVLKEHTGNLYTIRNWVVMPNHVHALVTPALSVSLESIIHQIKGQSARAINLAIGRTGRLWEVEYFDRYIRDQPHFERVAHYIEWNPVKAKLCASPEDWPWTSARGDEDCK